MPAHFFCRNFFFAYQLQKIRNVAAFYFILHVQTDDLTEALVNCFLGLSFYQSLWCPVVESAVCMPEQDSNFVKRRPLL